MTDLAGLAAELLPGAKVTAGSGAARQVAWVRVLRARVPAFDALEPGDLVIASSTALSVVAPAAGELRDLAGALAAVRVSGAILVEPEGAAAESGDALDAAAAAFTDAGIPCARAGRADVAALERSVVGFIVARGAELERQAALLESELRRRSLEGAGVAGLVAAVAAFLGRALVLEGGRGEPVVIHAPAEAPRAAADAARYQTGSASDRASVAARFDLPGAGTGRASAARGALLVLGSEPPSELARVTLPRVAGLLALELAREEAVRGAADSARREPMPSAGPPWVVLLARQREPGADDDAPAAREARESLRRAIRLLAPARRLHLRGDADSLEVRLVAAGPADETGRLAERAADLLGRPVAVSRPFSTTGDRPAAEAEARATLDAALSLDPAPRIAQAERLAIYRMLGALHKLPDGPRLARAVLEPLLDARPDVRRERVKTLRALLSHGGVGEAAAALGVHRNTIAYRLRRIEAATGWRLADPELRLPLAVALGLMQEEQV